MQELLFDQSVIKYPSRPTSNSLIRKAIELTTIDYCLWLGRKTNILSEEEIEDIASAIEYERDSFRMCKSLDDAGWNTDREMIDILEETLFKLDVVYEQAIKDWVKTNGIKPIYSIGDKVIFKLNRLINDGVIKKIYDKDARYVIDNSNIDCIVNYEDVISKNLRE